MKLHDFGNTGVYVGSREADICQLSGDMIMRINSTLIEPPTDVPIDSVIVWTGDKWAIFTPDPIPEPTIDELRLVMVLTKLEAKALLIERGLYTKINNEIMAMPDCLLKLKWTEAELFKRTDKDLESYLKNLGMTDEEIDDLFCKK